jgi:heme/copper-type cytochrome/quinol oxidase subunit 1
VFFPMHWAGIFGMPRRIYTYADELNLGAINMFMSIMAPLMAVGTAIFAWNLIRSWRHGAVAGSNPWGAATLEWATTSPPPHFNFAELPKVRSRNPLWDNPEDFDERVYTEPAGGVHMPNPSFWPLITAFGSALTLILFMTHIWWMPLIGLAVTAVATINWAFEPAG